MLRNYFLLLSADCVGDFWLAWNLVRIVCDHLNLLDSSLVLQNLLSKSLCLSSSGGLGARFGLPTCFKGAVKVTTPVQISPLQNDQVVWILFVQTTAVLLHGLLATQNSTVVSISIPLLINGISFLLQWKWVLESVLVGRLSCVWRLGYLRTWDIASVQSCALIAFRIFLMHDLIR